ncbi:TRADD-N-associated membrane domain-containing protein [Pseudomonas sp. DR48]|uniref:TRADD-N-associated membrane domain-containing protein n=1 Tax=Pseudomonas sp. DR48 TaxID=2871095 RepID=UPI001C992476|nr:hypothetical protein [Pseudomonas sp. DR48]QZP31489.1 hypothetical protein K5K95_25410 [Pseudomonas sp. DR48]
MFGTTIDILNFFIESLRRSPKARALVLIISLSGAIVGAVVRVLLLFAVPDFFIDTPELNQAAVNTSLGFMVGFGLLSVLVWISYSDLQLKGGDIFNIELERIREERNTIQERLSEAPKSEDVIDTIQLNLNQLSEYYVINKSQARTSFGFSVFAIVSGLVSIIGGVWLFYFKETPNFQLTAISSVAGVLAEFIGAAYFYVYRKSLEQLNFFFMQLVRMQDTMLSVRLCEQVLPEDRQMQLRAQIIMTLLQRSSQGVIFPQSSDAK